MRTKKASSGVLIGIVILGLSLGRPVVQGQPNENASCRAHVLAGDSSKNGEPPKEGAESEIQNTPDKDRSEEKKLEANSTASEKASGGAQLSNKQSDGGASDKQKQPKAKQPVSGWVGYSCYVMNDFNRKLSGEGNDTIDGGINIGIEFVPKGLKIGAFGLEFSPFPVGMEYLGASSKTTHTNGGASTTVDWQLPVIGIYFWPEVHFLERPKEQNDHKDLIGWKRKWRLRPIGVGYYTLGKLMDATLDISGVPGRLEVHDESIGFMSQFGIKFVNADETQGGLCGRRLSSAYKFVAVLSHSFYFLVYFTSS